jgi:hypothetical protein
MLRHCALALTLGVLSWSAEAATLEFRPNGDYVWTGNYIDIDVVATLEGAEQVGSYGLAITWDFSYLEFAGITFDEFLGGPSGSVQVYDDGIGALVVTETAQGPLSSQDGQDEIRLFSFKLLAAAIGTGPLQFGSATLKDAGANTLPLTAFNTTLTTVPGPATGLLLGSALALAGARVRRRRVVG